MDTNEQTTDIAIETSIADNEQTTSFENVPLEGSTAQLPGVISLIKSGFGIYRERVGTLVGASALQFLSLFFIFIPMALAFFLRGYIVIDIIAILLSTLVGALLYFWLMLTSMEIIHGHTQKVSLRQALHTARTKTLPFIGMLIIAFLIVIGIGVLLSILSSAIIASLGVLSGMYYLATELGGAVTVISWLIVGILFSIWFAFSYWVFIDEDKRGIDALVASRELIRKDVGAIFWRLFATAFLVYLAYYIISVLNSLLFSGAVQSVVSFLLYLTSALFLVPLMLSIVYEIFLSVKARVGTEVQQNKKLHKYFRWYAIFGAVAIFLFIIVMFFIGGSISHTFVHV